MIKSYFVEDLTLEKVDKLIESGEVFNVRNKTPVLPETRVPGDRDEVWGIGNNDPHSVRETVARSEDSKS